MYYFWLGKEEPVPQTKRLSGQDFIEDFINRLEGFRKVGYMYGFNVWHMSNKK